MKKKIILISAILGLFFLISAQAALACYCSDCGCDCVGTGTPGYWKNHPEAWPVNSIEIGSVWYTVSEAIAMLDQPVKGDKSITIFKALVAAKLNVAAGACDCCIDFQIEMADLWLEWYPYGSGVKASGAQWQEWGECLYWDLDDYNNGRLCAPSRDSLE